jgi:hypothetical protein
MGSGSALEPPQATNRDAKISPPIMGSSITVVSTTVSKQQFAFATTPMMAILPLAPILGPFGGDQLIVALNALRPEA